MSETRRVNEPLARGARTVVQAVPAATVTEFIDAFFYDMDDKQYGALLAMLLVLFSVAQAMIENKVGYALFRKFSRTNPPLVQTPETPLVEPGANNLPTKVNDAQRGGGL